MNFLKYLNEQQLEATKHIDGPMLILAGAGTGKTKTITSRLAYLISLGIDPASILTLTFTNKAASEMSLRAMKLVREELEFPISYPPILSTFHKFGLLFLKFHIDELNRKNNFVIIDTDDKKRIIKNLNNSNLQNRYISNEISRLKNSLVTAENSIEIDNKDFETITKVYKKYEEYLIENNLVDFDDLLILPYKILDANDELCKTISTKYQYIMVDEYQDTNDLQYQLLKKLCRTHNNLCVVGDDDQSIYGWRGANINNILDFSKDFKNTKIIKLETNYRSTNQILQAANNLISNNKSRMDKKLTSNKGSGPRIEILETLDEKQEARIIASRISELLKKKTNSKEIAILFRINALSRSVEEALNRERISYKMIGGMRFYERMEVKDIISYLRVITNNQDDYSLKRIINRPKRGIGKASIEKMSLKAYENKKTLYDYIKDNQNELSSLIPKKAFNNIVEFITNLEMIKSNISNVSYDLSELCDDIEDTYEIRKYYALGSDATEKLPNIDEFYALYKDKFKSNPELSIDEFLNEITLLNDQDQIELQSISVMSIHASKGLEFTHLFVIGYEEGFFPLLGEGSDLEEERRLGYVAITRSKEYLTLSTSKSRFYKGRRSDLIKSRFLQESELVKTTSINFEQPNQFKKGDLVKHKVFGIGRVTEVNKMKKEYKLKINFGGNIKDIMSSFLYKV
ncbi:MAG: ATP-dependent DNA helicase UvrD/PcrA/Rep, epsilon proteobacterial type 2 [uncultured Campylobacterales bacterium]|uniref:DNA 3'-5' helicase n=1 Tax=uncultured Campylobacterales bacterium TaxID=352960 RepID=A0A6S6S4R6_9BACT|nr:MAG: ATP-dependent DNA helicase UvrD/PcrA/Rep, epsilon proteobacterial type 2 [uncultured Campylobacterales bacterium]